MISSFMDNMYFNVLEDFMNADSNVLLLPLYFFGLYMILEAADWGLCLAAPLVSRNREENRAILGLLKPGLDGNELWYFLGMIMMGAAIPGIADGPTGGSRTVLILLVALGAVLRLAAAFMRNTFSHSAVMKGMSLFSLLALVTMGLLSAFLLTPEKSVFSFSGILCALWMVLASFQLGTLYGAVKIVNPLGERFRAAFLVSGVLTVAVYIILVVLLKNIAGDSLMYGSFFWISLVATALLFIAAFFFTRMRHVNAGLVAVYVSSFFAITIYLSAYAAVLPTLFPVNVNDLKQVMDEMPGMALLTASFVWTLASFLWRQMRKKENYEWKDHI